MEAIGMVYLALIMLLILIPVLVIVMFIIRDLQWYYRTGFFIFLLFLAYLKLEYVKSNIQSKSIERFGIEPKYIKINFNMVWKSHGTPHAIVRKDGKVYCWSFGENDFLYYYQEKPTSESLEKLFNKYIFKKDKIK